VDITWKLRMAAAQREVWTGTQLRRLLAERAGLEMSAASVSALFTKQPSEVDTTPVERPASRPARGEQVRQARASSGRGRSMPPL
jgi:putative transcriptional regulator